MIPPNMWPLCHHVPLISVICVHMGNLQGTAIPKKNNPPSLAGVKGLASQLGADGSS